MLLHEEEWMDLRAYRALRDAGATWAEIARESGHDWRTVKRYLGPDAPPRPSRQSPRPAQPKVIDPYTQVVDAMLANEPRIKASVIHERLVADHGFDASYQRVKLYVAARRPVIAPAPRRVLRPLRGPGRAQAQVDWGDEGTIETATGPLAVYSFHMTLSYSRDPFCRFVARQDLGTFYECHRLAFEHFGGVPAEIVYDRTKTVVRHHVGRGQDTPLHPEAVAFAGHYGFAIRLAAPRRPQTKGCASHCTSCDGCGNRFGVGPAGWRSTDLLAGDDEWHPVVVLPLVVEPLCLDAALVLPLLDSARAHAHPGRRLRELDQPPGRQALPAVSETVVAADVVDQAGMERLPSARDHPGPVESGGHAAFGVVVEEAVDLGDDVSRRAPGLGSGEPDGDVQRLGLAATEAHVDGDVMIAPQGDVLDEETDHAFALPLGGAGIGPQGRKVRRQGGDAGLVGLPQGRRLGALALVVLLRLGQGSQGVVPVGLQVGGHQPVVGVDGQVATPGRLGAVSGPLHVLAA